MPRRTKDSSLDLVMSALANPTRRDILDELMTGERSAGELAGMFDMSRPSVSEHLRALRDAELVDETQVGRLHVYRVSGEPLGDLMDWLSPYERFWRGRMASLGEVLNRLEDDE